MDALQRTLSRFSHDLSGCHGARIGGGIDGFDGRYTAYLYAILAREGDSMIDPVQLPILMKAIDFVFDEGRKILEERRERRRLNDASSKSDDQQPVDEVALPAPEREKEVKQDLLASKIDEIVWHDNEWIIEKLVKTLDRHIKSYYILKEQEAQWGSALVPPIILLQIEQKENSIIETRNQLETALSKVYKKDINLVK